MISDHVLGWKNPVVDVLSRMTDLECTIDAMRKIFTGKFSKNSGGIVTAL